MRITLIQFMGSLTRGQRNDTTDEDILEMVISEIKI